jgi:hypothetical protein
MTARTVDHSHPYSIVTVKAKCHLPWMPGPTGPSVIEVQGDARAYFRTNLEKVLLARQWVTVDYVCPAQPEAAPAEIAVCDVCGELAGSLACRVAHAEAEQVEPEPAGAQDAQYSQALPDEPV